MQPRTPDADEESRTRSDDPDAIPGPRTGRTTSDSRTSDEINRMLSSSLEKPEPDPMLGGPGSWDAEKTGTQTGARRSRSGDDLDIGVDVASSSGASRKRVLTHQADSRIDWPNLLLKSYASAVTLALAWVLWSGRSVVSSSSNVAPDPAEARRRVLNDDGSTTAEVSPVIDRSTVLGKPLVVGDLEVLPLTILRKNVRASFDQGGNTEVREFPGCLALTLRIKNRGDANDLEPIDPLDFNDRTAFMVEAPPGPPIPLFSSGASAGRKIPEQVFPKISAGESEDVTLVSEPIPTSRMTSSMLWRFRLSCGPDGSERIDLTVKFGRDDVPGTGP